MFNENIQHHSYELESEKHLHVVIKGIPERIDSKNVEEDLKYKGFNPIEIKRLDSRKFKTPLAMILPNFPNTWKK